MRKISLKNQKFGRLTVYSERIRFNSKTYWDCKCDCGSVTKVIQGNLLSGKTKSCGCLRNEIATDRIKDLPPKRLKLGQGSCNFLYNRYKQSAKKKKLSFDLSIEEFTSLTSSNCHYCNSKPNTEIKGRRSFGSYLFNGLDRIDSNQGYNLFNVLPCCSTCNYAKREKSYTEFIEWIERLVSYRGKI